MTGTLSAFGVAPKFPADLSETQLKQQDKAARWQDKIANTDVVEAYLAEHDPLLDVSALFRD